MPMFRKKPVQIEARRVPLAEDGPAGLDRMVELADWCGGRVFDHASHGDVVLIRTLEGEMLAAPGNWIIRGVAGEFYPCKPDIFAATYEPAPADEGTEA